MTELHHFLAARIYDDELLADKREAEGKWTPEQIRRGRAEITLKRGILLDYMIRLRQWETHYGRDSMPDDMVLRYLSVPYQDHPEYEPAWTPPEPGTRETWGRR